MTAADLPAPLLKPAEVARVLNVTVTQVYTLMRSGDLPALKIGKKGVWRVSRETLEAYLADLEAEARQRTRCRVALHRGRPNGAAWRVPSPSSHSCSRWAMPGHVRNAAHRGSPASLRLYVSPAASRGTLTTYPRSRCR